MARTARGTINAEVATSPGIAGCLNAKGFPDGDEVGLLAGLAHRLREAGLAVDRLILHQRTLHPEILARAVAWAPNEPIEIYDQQFGFDLSLNFAGSPLHRVMETGAEEAIRLVPATSPAWFWCLTLGRRNLVELVIMPLGNIEGPVSTLTFGTARPGGFAPSDRLMLQHIAPAVREAYEAQQTATAP
ncbi:hypothetical protein GCM10011611_28330 [Aliidongia dinghuensis]|uniref:Uncharacterized protein n=1 Tax=Aliidongia dinghuensis TaxID=1867774 RepID=A0A8J2YTU3_9PROT|nr:hypothetical protein [Aliidongia dinghuensis]GGF20633.1 hypothetical protein GCM10011611_28330 [Aliidongia dinghuensis]